MCGCVCVCEREREREREREGDRDRETERDRERERERERESERALESTSPPTRSANANPATLWAVDVLHLADVSPKTELRIAKIPTRGPLVTINR